MSIISEKIPVILAGICQTEEVKRNPDLALFENGVMDSFGVVELIVACEEELGIQVAITDFDREEWATPRLIIKKLEGWQ
jgi:D-alanine--poly(phosphoribitol) ligase subunit 2